MGRQGFEQLKVWQRSMDLVEAVYRLTQSFPADEKSGMTAGLRRGVAVMPVKIAAGHDAGDHDQYTAALRGVQRELRDMNTTLLVARRLGYATRWKLGSVRRRVLKLIDLIDRLLDKLAQSDIAGRVDGASAETSTQRAA